MNFRTFVKKIWKWLLNKNKTKVDEPLSPDAGERGIDAIPFDDLNFVYGGWKPHKDISVKAQIADLRLNKNNLYYRWQEGGCEMLGAKDAKTASCLACLFVRQAGTWRGGKFDWISTSRTSRDFKNVHAAYNGWPTDAIEVADAYAFVICATNGRARTNVITYDGRVQ